MSFRRYVYYCAWCGGIAAYASWALGRLLAFDNALVHAACQGLLFGFSVAVTLGVVDVLWNLPTAKMWRIASRAMTVAVVGALGGMLGGVFGEALHNRLPFEVVRMPGWFCTGLVIGAGLGVADMLMRLIAGERVAGSFVRMRRAGLGGALGGFVGGFVYLLLSVVCNHFLTDTDPLWSPDALGNVALGVCVGLGVALAQALGMDARNRDEEREQNAPPADKMIS